MPLVFNGTTVSQTTPMKFNGVNLTQVYFNGVKVWEIKAPPGSQSFISNGTFIVPTGIYSINVALVGGGGGGYASDDRGAGGGHASPGYLGTQAVTPGQSISVVVGAGGAGGFGSYTYGFGGGATYLAGGVLGYAAGGVRGEANGAGTGCISVPGGYEGNGAGHVSPYNGATYYDGVKNCAWGGQASMFASGGRGGYNPGTISTGGGYGAGGGAQQRGFGTYPAGSGGNGRAIISWS